MKENYKKMSTEERRERRLEALKEWCYTSLWMNRYDYECENDCYYINDPRHSVKATVDQLKRRWPDEHVPPREWFEGVIYDKVLWRKIDVDADEWMANCHGLDLDIPTA